MADRWVERLRLSTDVQSVLHCLLERSLEICQSSRGNAQLMNWDCGYLEIKEQRGFDDEFLNYFERVGLGGSSACAQALSGHDCVVVEDVTLDPRFATCSAILRRAGVRAVQSTPLVSASGALVGVLSTHFPTPHRPTGSQMNALRAATSSAADAIIRLRAAGHNAGRVQRSLKLLDECRHAILRADKVLCR
jgi:GAF domain-containing protein